MKNDIKNKFQGCFVGGAIGDALGYPIEFLGIKSIQKKYGQKGIKKYKKNMGTALVSDDTQMTMFTAAGIIDFDISDESENMYKYIYYNYLNWLTTQGFKNECAPVSWLYGVRDLYFRRAPGNTCLSSLRSGKIGTIENPINDSKGCGGVMRVAPIGLYFSNKNSKDAIIEAANAAAITHGEPMGYISSGLFAYIICELIKTDKSIVAIMKDGIKECYSIFGNVVKEQEDIIKKAISLINNDKKDYENIEDIGGGWTGETALAIAIYCCLKYKNDFTKAVIAAVNHSGDSDSTGAICGNIMGAIVGLDKIPNTYKNSLELYDEIIILSNDLYYCTYDKEKLNISNYLH